MNITITLPEELGKRMTAVAQFLHMDIDVLAIDALLREGMGAVGPMSHNVVVYRMLI